MFKQIRYGMTVFLVLIATPAVRAQEMMRDTVCVGASRIYKVNDASVPSTYSWTVNGILQPGNGHTLQLTWPLPGLYALTVQEHANNGCDGDVRTGMVYVTPPPVANAGPDQLVCYGQPVQLTGSGGATYLWSPAHYFANPADAQPQIRLPRAGVYTFVLQAGTPGCPATSQDSVTVTMRPPARIDAGPDIRIAAGQPLTLQAGDPDHLGFTLYRWTPAAGLNNSTIPNPVVQLNQPGTMTYQLSGITAAGCEARDAVTITVYAKADLYVPTAFTPNGDGRNDQAVVIAAGIRELQFFRIYNRWGELVFQTRDPGKGWDGLYKGKPQDSHVFVWEARAIDYSGQLIVRKGTITLIR